MCEFSKTRRRLALQFASALAAKAWTEGTDLVTVADTPINWLGR